MGEEEKCPLCGESMEKGFVIGGRGISWWPNMPFPVGAWGDVGESIARSGRTWQLGWSHLPAHRCKKCKIILIRAPEMEISKDKLPETRGETYERLLNAYVLVHGAGSKQVLEREIKSLMKKGLSREEAIRKLAEKEGLIGKG